ncbi:MAG: hypothetical protein DVB25_07310 [Verrucomicrobia bacterium]|nr:MAG: hypothetical protein DVB25_07310 [Verrucomicrobiota bacterium]
MLPALAVLAAFAALLLPLAAQDKLAFRADIRLLAFQPDQALDEVFAHDPALPETAAAAAVAVKVPVKSYLNHECSTVTLTGRRIVFTTRPDRGSLARPEDLLGVTVLAEGVHSAILLCLPVAAGDKGRFRLLAIDDSKRVFPAGSFRVFNLSTQPVRIVLEEKTFDFKPGDIQLITDPPVRDGNQSGMQAFAFQDNVWQRIGSGIWPHPGKNRVVQVLFTDPATGQVQLRAYDDVPPREPTAPAKGLEPVKAPKVRG